jgi:hypothetical protein
LQSDVIAQVIMGPKLVIIFPPVPKLGSRDPSAAKAGVTPAKVLGSATNQRITLWRNQRVILFSFNAFKQKAWIR